MTNRTESVPNPMLVDHPLIRVKMARLRAKETPSGEFRALLCEIAALMAYPITLDLGTRPVEVATPMRDGCPGEVLEGFLKTMPDAAVGHIGMFRNEETLRPESYYWKMPSMMDRTDVVLLDPMLATGRSAETAISQLKKDGFRSIRFACVVSCPEGLRELTRAHPDVRIFTAAVDDGLDEKGYILPGLGDAGDRIFGTA